MDPESRIALRILKALVALMVLKAAIALRILEAIKSFKMQSDQLKCQHIGAITLYSAV